MFLQFIIANTDASLSSSLIFMRYKNLATY